MNPTDESLLLQIFRQNKLAISLFMISFLLLIGVLISYFAQYAPAGKEEIIFDQASEAPQVASVEVKATTILVDVSGGVVRPGVYTLPIDSRLQDAVVAAGGISDMGDSIQIAQKLNLAEKIRDGQKIYIPVLGEEYEATVGVTEKRININTASVTELDSLPGIGETTAQKIVSSRPYEVIDDLQARKVVGSKVFADIKDQISVD